MEVDQLIGDPASFLDGPDMKAKRLWRLEVQHSAGFVADLSSRLADFQPWRAVWCGFLSDPVPFRRGASVLGFSAHMKGQLHHVSDS